MNNTPESGGGIRERESQGQTKGTRPIIFIERTKGFGEGRPRRRRGRREEEGNKRSSKVAVKHN